MENFGLVLPYFSPSGGAPPAVVQPDPPRLYLPGGGTRAGLRGERGLSGAGGAWGWRRGGGTPGIEGGDPGPATASKPPAPCCWGCSPSWVSSPGVGGFWALLTPPSSCNRPPPSNASPSQPTQNPPHFALPLGFLPDLCTQAFGAFFGGYPCFKPPPFPQLWGVCVGVKQRGLTLAARPRHHVRLVPRRRAGGPGPVQLGGRQNGQTEGKLPG